MRSTITLRLTWSEIKDGLQGHTHAAFEVLKQLGAVVCNLVGRDWARNWWRSGSGGILAPTTIEKKHTALRSCLRLRDDNVANVHYSTHVGGEP